MITLLVSLWYISSGALAIHPCYVNHQLSNIEGLVHNIALIESDGRKIRNPGDVSANIEKAQSRIYCLKKPFTKGKVPTKEELLARPHSLANAVLAFQNDMAIVDRHMFLDKDGKKVSSVQNCYLEHISSGQIVHMTDVEFPAQPNDGNSVNNNTSKPADVLTITTCLRYGQYNLPSGALSNAYGTDCDTGAGSSGAQAYIEENGTQKLFGIVSGDIIIAPAGGPWDAKKLSTIVVGFDETLFNSYRKLKDRTSR